MSAPILLENLKKSYGTVEAVRNISFEMKEGEVFGLLGPNGAGKTSIISVLTSLEKATSGRALVFGEDVQEERPETKAKLGFVPQELISHGFFSIEEVLMYTSGFFGISDNKEQVDYLLKRLGLEAHRTKKVRELSGGMKRRFLIAKALVHKPRLLLLDEPTAGVDIELRNNLWEFVRELNKDGVSVLLTTHYLEEAENLCNRVAIIHMGQLKKIGPTDQLIKNLTQRQVVFSVQRKSENLNMTFVTKSSENEIICKIPSDMQLGELMAKLNLETETIVDIKIREGRLEDAFLNVLSGV